MIVSRSEVTTFTDRIQEAVNIEPASVYPDENEIRFRLPLASDDALAVTCGCFYNADGYFCLLNSHDLRRADADSYKKLISAINKMLKQLGMSGHKDGTNICVEFASEDAMANRIQSILNGLSQISDKF